MHKRYRLVYSSATSKYKEYNVARDMKHHVFFIIISLILCGCATTKYPAPIIYNHAGETNSITYNAKGLISNGSFVTKHTEIIEPSKSGYVVPNKIPKGSKFIYHEVQSGDTLEKIAKQYAKDIKEIALVNDLYPPYYLDEFQIIKIRVARNYRVPAKSNKKKVIKKPKIPDFINPLKGVILSKFGDSTQYGKNKGVNIAGRQGAKVLATADGKVIYADYDAVFGHLVIIKLENNIITSYAHLEDIILSKGDGVKQGDVIGYVGSTGKVTKPQLHFGIRDGKIAKDPLKYINRK